MSRLLVVDDEANIRLLYSAELTDEGYEVETAATIAEALEKLAQKSFDLVLLDIKLKNESGIELLQKIVKERHDMPVILCSAFSSYKDDFSAWLADSYVVKSGDLTELKEEVRRVLEKKAQRRAAGRITLGQGASLPGFRDEKGIQFTGLIFRDAGYELLIL